MFNYCYHTVYIVFFDVIQSDIKNVIHDDAISLDFNLK